MRCAADGDENRVVEAREWTELFFMFGPIEVMEERVRAPAGLSALCAL